MKLQRDVEKIKISKDVQSPALSLERKNDESYRGCRSQQQQKNGNTPPSAITSGASRLHTYVKLNALRNDIQLISPDLPSTANGMGQPY